MRISRNFCRQKPGNRAVTDEAGYRKLFLDIPNMRELLYFLHIPCSLHKMFSLTGLANILFITLEAYLHLRSFQFFFLPSSVISSVICVSVVSYSSLAFRHLSVLQGFVQFPLNTFSSLMARTVLLTFHVS